MARNQFEIDDRPSSVRADSPALTGFCDALDATKDLSSFAIAAAARRTGLTTDAEDGAVAFAVSLLVLACPYLLDAATG